MVSQKTIDLTTVLFAALGICLALFYVATGGNETVGLLLIGGAITSTIGTII